jgi:hypothetical protein
MIKEIITSEIHYKNLTFMKKSLTFLVSAVATFAGVGISFNRSALAIEPMINLFTFEKVIATVRIGTIIVKQEERWVTEGGIRGGCPENDGQGCTPSKPGKEVLRQVANITAILGIPNCPNRSHLEGSVVVKYTNGQAYITRTHILDANNEGKDWEVAKWTIPGYFGDPRQGNVNVDVSARCVNH